MIQIRVLVGATMNYLGMNRQAEQVDGPSLYFIGMLCLEQMTNKEIRHELKFKKKKKKKCLKPCIQSSLKPEPFGHRNYFCTRYVCLII